MNYFAHFAATARPSWNGAWSLLEAEYSHRFNLEQQESRKADLIDQEDKLDVVEGGHHPFSYEMEAPRRALRSWKSHRATQHK